jgi:hypothetical protein
MLLAAMTEPKASPPRRFSFSPTEFIRESLYAALADALERYPLRDLLKVDPTRAYTSSIALALLDVSTASVTLDGTLIGVGGQRFALAECPQEWKPFVKELADIGMQAKEIEAEDLQAAEQQRQRREYVPISRMEMVRTMLLYDGNGPARGGRAGNEAMLFVGRVRALSKGIMSLYTFKERQGVIFNVLEACAH